MSIIDALKATFKDCWDAIKWIAVGLTIAIICVIIWLVFVMVVNNFMGGLIVAVMAVIFILRLRHHLNKK